MLRAFAVVLAALLPLAGADARGVSPSDPQREIESVERALEFGRERERKLQEQQHAIAKELQEIARDAVEAARRVQRQEAAVTATEDKLRDLIKATEDVQADLRRRHNQLVGTLAALQRLAQRPPEALLAMPAPPIDTVRTAMLLGAIVPPLEADAASLREELDRVDRLRKETRRERDKLAVALTDLRRDRQALAKLADRKAVLRDRAAAESRDVAARVAALGKEARDLRDLLARLEAERRAEEEKQRKAEEERRRREAQARRRDDDASRRTAEIPRKPEPRSARADPDPLPGGGRLDLIQPAQGRIARRYGEGTAPRNQGVTLETRESAQVVAPRGGRVAYVGPFRGYGLLLIIEHGGGYHSLLTGFSRIDAAPGQRVVAGEPVGIMGTADPERPQLYMELRHNGQPVNPLPSLTAQKG